MATATATPVTSDESLVRSLGFDYDRKEVALDKINADSSAFNYRLTRLDEEKAIQYGIAMENGATFPEIVVHSEAGITGYVIDSGVHRVHGRNQTNFKTITALVLKNLDLKDPKVVAKLDDLRIALNLGHGLGLDQAERKLIACNQVAAGTRTIEAAAQFFDLDVRVLRDAFHNYELDLELRRYGLKPENFTRQTDKESVLRKGMTQDEMRDVERLIVRYSSSDAGRRVSSEQIKKLTRDLVEARSSQEKAQVFEALRADLASTRKRATNKNGNPVGQAHNPSFRLRGAMGTIETLDVHTLVAMLSNSEVATEFYKDIKATIDRLASLENRIAKKWDLPAIQVLP